jgi:hypothetical protein
LNLLLTFCQRRKNLPHDPVMIQSRTVGSG